MKGVILLTKRDRARIKIMDAVIKKYIKLKEASNILNISYRQAKRLKRQYKTEGSIGLIHKSRGKRSNRKTDDDLREQILNRYKERYLDFGPTFSSEKLLKDGFKINHDTLRRWLIEEKLWIVRKNKQKHRIRRERKHHFGEMIQLDGSHHNWFDDKKSCLMNMVDDATNTTLSILAEEETTEAAMILLWEWIKRYGIPFSLYCDKKNVYITGREPSLEEQLKGIYPITAFGRVCEKLGISIITAHSPQAKGRVERNHGVYQDRFVKELKLNDIHDINEANNFLRSDFIDEINNKFSREPLGRKNMHKKLPKSLDLQTIFCYEDYRKVSKDWVVQYKNKYFQIVSSNRNLPRTGSIVTINEWLDKSIHIYYNEKELKIQDITEMVLQNKLKNVS